MSKELEPKDSGHGAMEPYRDKFAERRAALEPTEVEPWYQPVHLTERPEWTELRPPFNPDSKLEQTWSTWLVPFRFVALVFLWVTFAWHRAVLALTIVVALYVLIYS